MCLFDVMYWRCGHIGRYFVEPLQNVPLHREGQDCDGEWVKRRIVISLNQDCHECTHVYGKRCPYCVPLQPGQPFTDKIFTDEDLKGKVTWNFTPPSSKGKHRASRGQRDTLQEALEAFPWLYGRLNHPTEGPEYQSPVPTPLGPLYGQPVRPSDPTAPTPGQRAQQSSSTQPGKPSNRHSGDMPSDLGPSSALYRREPPLQQHQPMNQQPGDTLVSTDVSLSAAAAQDDLLHQTSRQSPNDKTDASSVAQDIVYNLFLQALQQGLTCDTDGAVVPPSLGSQRREQALLLPQSGPQSAPLSPNSHIHTCFPSVNPSYDSQSGQQRSLSMQFPSAIPLAYTAMHMPHPICLPLAKEIIRFTYNSTGSSLQNQTSSTSSGELSPRPPPALSTADNQDFHPEDRSASAASGLVGTGNNADLSIQHPPPGAPLEYFESLIASELPAQDVSPGAPIGYIGDIDFSNLSPQANSPGAPVGYFGHSEAPDLVMHNYSFGTPLDHFHGINSLDSFEQDLSPGAPVGYLGEMDMSYAFEQNQSPGAPIGYFNHVDSSTLF